MVKWLLLWVFLSTSIFGSILTSSPVFAAGECVDASNNYSKECDTFEYVEVTSSGNDSTPSGVAIMGKSNNGSIVQFFFAQDPTNNYSGFSAFYPDKTVYQAGNDVDDTVMLLTEGANSGVLGFSVNGGYLVDSDGEIAPPGGDPAVYTVSVAGDPDNPTPVDETGNTPADSESEETISCETEGGEFSWLACPMIKAILGAYEFMVGIISSLLSVRPMQANDNDPVFAVWKEVRNLALATLVIGALLLIIQQAVRPDTDAYLIKRMIPRLGGAVIGIVMSFYVCAIAIDFFNVVGQSLYELLTSATGNAIDFQVSLGSDIASALVIGFGVAGIVSVFNGPILAGIGLILLPLVLAVLTGFITILARQLILIMLVIVSPLAFAAWVLPNTESWLKKWWNFFSTMLMMYPIVMLLLASGVIVASIITNGALTTEGDGSLNENNFINYLLALVVLALAIGLIPFTLRVAGGVLGKFSGIINNRGPVEGLKKGMQERKDEYDASKAEEKAAKVRENPDKYKGLKGLNTRRRAGLLFRGRGDIGDVARQQRMVGAMTPESKMRFLEAKAREDRMKAEALRLGDSSNAQILAAATAAGATRETVTVAFKMLADQRGGAQAELEALQHHLADTRQVQLGAQLSRDNYPSINEGSPHLAQFDYTEANPDLRPNYHAIATRGRHQIGAVSDRSMGELVQHGTVADIQSTTRTYIEAGETNQAVNPVAVSVLYNYAMQNQQHFSAQQINQLYDLAGQPPGLPAPPPLPTAQGQATQQPAPQPQPPTTQPGPGPGPNTQGWTTTPSGLNVPPGTRNNPPNNPPTNPAGP